MGNQSGFIVGFILFAFFVYITLKGELPIYAGLLLLSPQGGSGGAGNASPTAQQAAVFNSNITGTLAGFGAFFGA